MDEVRRLSLRAATTAWNLPMSANEHRTCDGNPAPSVRRGMTRRLLRALVPPRMRQLARTVARELPMILRDSIADIRDRSLPGPVRRYEVAGTTSRAQFIEVGK